MILTMIFGSNMIYDWGQLNTTRRSSTNHVHYICQKFNKNGNKKNFQSTTSDYGDSKIEAVKRHDFKLSAVNWKEYTKKIST